MKRTLSLMLLAVLVFLSGCGTAPVQKEPIIPAKRPVSEYVQSGVTYTIEAYDPWEPLNRRIYNFNAIFDEYIYFMTGSPFEYDLIRRLYLLKREFLIDN